MFRQTRTTRGWRGSVSPSSDTRSNTPHIPNHTNGDLKGVALRPLGTFFGLPDASIQCRRAPDADSMEYHAKG